MDSPPHTGLAHPPPPQVLRPWPAAPRRDGRPGDGGRCERHPQAPRRHQGAHSRAALARTEDAGLVFCVFWDEMAAWRQLGDAHRTHRTHLTPSAPSARRSGAAAVRDHHAGRGAREGVQAEEDVEVAQRHHQAGEGGLRAGGFFTISTLFPLVNLACLGARGVNRNQGCCRRRLTMAQLSPAAVQRICSVCSTSVVLKTFSEGFDLQRRRRRRQRPLQSRLPQRA
jgi:hypothetical protein